MREYESVCQSELVYVSLFLLGCVYFYFPARLKTSRWRGIREEYHRESARKSQAEDEASLNLLLAVRCPVDCWFCSLNLPGYASAAATACFGLSLVAEDTLEQVCWNGIVQKKERRKNYTDFFLIMPAKKKYCGKALRRNTVTARSLARFSPLAGIATLQVNEMKRKRKRTWRDASFHSLGGPSVGLLISGPAFWVVTGPIAIGSKKPFVLWTTE